MKTTHTKKMDHWNATDYSQNASAQSLWADELIAKLHLRGDETVLDIGCGDGNVSARLAKKLPGGKVTGIDSSHSMFSLALAQLEHIEDQNLHFQIMDAMHIKLPEKFDIAFSNAALHWVEDHAAVLDATHRHLKQNGRILFQMGGKGNAALFLDILGEIIANSEWGRYFTDFNFPYHFYGIDEYETWLEENGFTTQRIELIPKKMMHNSSEDLKGWFRTTWFPYTNRLPEELREQFINTVVDEYISEVPLDAQNRTRVDMVRLEVEASRC